MTVPSARSGLTVNRRDGMPRIAVVPTLPEIQTPARSRSTDGSHVDGGEPVSASQALVSKATPALAVVSPNAYAVRLQPVAGEPPSGPVPSSRRTAPSPIRRVLPETSAQSR